MEQDKKHDIALMRYSVISPLITGLQEDFPSLDAFFRDASLKGITAPDGSVRKYAPAPLRNGTVPTNRAALMHFSPLVARMPANPENWMMKYRSRSGISKPTTPHVSRSHLQTAAG